MKNGTWIISWLIGLLFIGVFAAGAFDGISSVKLKPSHLHQYEIVYFGVDNDWEAARITDTITCPKIERYFLASDPEDKSPGQWLFLMVGQEGQKHYARSTATGRYYSDDLIIFDSWVDSLVSVRKLPMK